MYSDLASMAREVVMYLESGEIEKAVARVAAERQQQVEASFHARIEAVDAVNRALMEAKKAKERILSSLEKLPADIRLDAQHQMIQVLDDTFSAEIERLRAEKRRLSKPL